MDTQLLDALAWLAALLSLSTAVLLWLASRRALAVSELLRQLVTFSRQPLQSSREIGVLPILQLHGGSIVTQRLGEHFEMRTQIKADEGARGIQGEEQPTARTYQADDRDKAHILLHPRRP